MVATIPEDRFRRFPDKSVEHRTDSRSHYAPYLFTASICGTAGAEKKRAAGDDHNQQRAGNGDKNHTAGWERSVTERPELAYLSTTFHGKRTRRATLRRSLFQSGFRQETPFQCRNPENGGERLWDGI